MTKELKDCPFCGGKGKPKNILRGGYEVNDPDAWAYFIICLSCAAQGSWAKSPSAALLMWNMRQEQ